MSDETGNLAAPTTHNAERGAPIDNPPARVPWWDYRAGPPTLDPMRGSLLPCGCHVREPDYVTVLCAAHLAELNGPTRVTSHEGDQ